MHLNFKFKYSQKSGDLFQYASRIRQVFLSA